MANATALIVSFAAYLGILFLISRWATEQSETSARLFNGGWIYAFSIAVYCTTWTFFGSVGLVASQGLTFITVYFGPILVFLFAPLLLKKILRICKQGRITSIADFISARYGKSQFIAGFVTTAVIIGVVPYLSLQLKAVAYSIHLMREYPVFSESITAYQSVFYEDIAFYLTATIAIFIILTSTRQLDASEQHRGMMAAVAFESVLKLIAFLVVGLYVTYGMFDGVGDIISKARDAARLTALSESKLWVTDNLSFWTLTGLSALAIICLPRQFHVTFVENTDEKHLQRARWLFPLYLIAINIFVIPLALAGQLIFLKNQSMPILM